MPFLFGIVFHRGILYSVRVEIMSIRNRIKKLFTTKERPEFNKSVHKICEECGGSGLDFIAGPCFDCEGNGFVDQTAEDKIKQALQYRK